MIELWLIGQRLARVLDDQRARLRTTATAFAGELISLTSGGMKMKVLIADDDKSVRNSLRKVLEEANYEVLLAADGEEALDAFEREDIDLLLLDIGLPAKNGWDTFERITTENPALPIIMITGQSDQYKVAAAAGVGVLMEKPLDAPMLLRTIGELLSETRESRLQRMCGCKRNTRFVLSASTLFLRELRERYAAPMRSTLMNKIYF